MLGNLQSLFKDDPFKDFYNLNGLNTVILTSDIDWAPDYATAAVLDLVSEFGFKITTFATHKSSLLSSCSDFVEIGLHPDNTRPDPTHRFNTKISDLKEIFPDAVGVRGHRNFFGQNISDLAKKSGLIYDLSSFLWAQPFCQAHIDYNGLVKMSYSWEDGIHVDLNKSLTLEHVKLHTPGLKVLNVHPMLIYLNGPDDNLRRKLTYGISDLTAAPEHLFKEHIYKGYGVQSLYRDLLKYLKENNVKTYFARDVAKIGLKGI